MFDLSSIMGYLKHHFTRRDVLIIVVLMAGFFVLRLIWLDKFPIFNDEGIYINWARIAKADPSYRFISLTDGKQPLQTWGTIPLLKLFPDNALLAGRLYAVMTGFAALCGIFAILFLLFDKKTAYLGAFFYTLTPYAIFYDRIALADSSVNAACIWILFFSLLLARYQRLDVALLFGLTGGFGLLTKSSVQVFLGLSALAPVMFVQRFDRKTLHKLLNFYILLAVAVGMAVFIYNIQRLSPWLQNIGQKNLTFVMSLTEIQANPFLFLPHNLIEIPRNIAWESGFVVTLLGCVGLIQLLVRKQRAGYYVGLWILIFFGIVSMIAKVTFPRYFIFLNTLFLLLAAYAVGQLRLRRWLLGALAIFLASVAYFNYTIIVDYANIPFPPVDRGQYIEGWPAGFGVNTIMSLLREKQVVRPVILIVEGDFGSGDVFNSLLRSGDHIYVHGYWPLGEKELRDNQKELKDKYVYVVFPHRTDFPPEWPLKLVYKLDKPNHQSALYLFELTR